MSSHLHRVKADKTEAYFPFHAPASTPDTIKAMPTTATLPTSPNPSATQIASSVQPAKATHSDSESTIQEPRLWVRIPYPLSSFVRTAVQLATPKEKAIGEEHNSLAKISYQYQTPAGWFSFGFSQLRELNVSALESASDSLWEGSRKPAIPRSNLDGEI